MISLVKNVLKRLDLLRASLPISYLYEKKDFILSCSNNSSDFLYWQSSAALVDRQVAWV